MRKRILIVSNVSGGLYGFRQELISELVENNDVMIMSSDNGHVDDFIKLGCTFIKTEFDRHNTNPLKELELISLYKNKIRELKPDIVLTYTIKPNIYAGMVCASLGIPYVANITGLGTALENGGLLQKVSVTLYRYGLRKAQKVFFQNTENQEFMLKHKVVRGAYDLLPGSGVNLERYHILDYPQGETVDFVFIARIMKEKGIEQYLDAARYIREKYPQTRFHVCGNCEQAYEETLKKLNDNGIIIYHGRIDDVVGMHTISQCTIHPTYYPEGMSNVLLESCACGRPIITTNRSGCKEIVEDGVNGFVVRQKDSADLIEKIETFLGLSWEERRNMGLAGRLKVEQEFDRQIVVNKYMEEINNSL